MKKISLICAIALAGLSLTACGSNSNKKASSSSKVSSSKVVKHHKKAKQSKKKASSSNSPSAVSASSQQNQQQQTQASNRQQQASQAPSNNDGGSTLERNARASVGADGLIHGRIYGDNGYWIDADASRQGLADAGMPNSDADILAHGETGNAMYNNGR